MNTTYLCRLNWHGERHIVYTTARSAAAASRNACAAIARHLGIDPGVVVTYVRQYQLAITVEAVTPYACPREPQTEVQPCPR